MQNSLREFSLSREYNPVLSVVNQCLKTVASYISSTLIAVCYGREAPYSSLYHGWKQKLEYLPLGAIFLPFVVCVFGGLGREIPELSALL